MSVVVGASTSEGAAIPRASHTERRWGSRPRGLWGCPSLATRASSWPLFGLWSSLQCPPAVTLWPGPVLAHVSHETPTCAAAASSAPHFAPQGAALRAHPPPVRGFYRVIQQATVCAGGSAGGLNPAHHWRPGFRRSCAALWVTRLRRPYSSSSRCGGWRAGAAGRLACACSRLARWAARRGALICRASILGEFEAAGTGPRGASGLRAGARPPLPAARRFRPLLPRSSPLQQQQQDCDVHGPRKPTVAPLDASPASNIHVLVVSCRLHRLRQAPPALQSATAPSHCTSPSALPPQVDDERLTRVVLSGLLMKCGYRGELQAAKLLWLRRWHGAAQTGCACGPAFNARPSLSL